MALKLPFATVQANAVYKPGSIQAVYKLHGYCMLAGEYDPDAMAFPGADDEVIPTLASVRAAEEAAAAEAKRAAQKPYQGKVRTQGR